MKKNYILTILVALDQLGNAIAGGNEDSTISARLGYLYLYRRQQWTTVLMKIVDFTFYSVDGKDHCLQAYVKDNESNIRGNNLALAILSILIIAFCVVIFIPVQLVALYLNLSTKDLVN